MVSAFQNCVQHPRFKLGHHRPADQAKNFRLVWAEPCPYRNSFHSGEEYRSISPLTSSSLNSGHGSGRATTPSASESRVVKSSWNASQAIAAPPAAERAI